MGRKKKSSVSSVPNGSNIAEDVIVEILSRLPLRSLPRFTCVSKQWSSLISTITATKTRSPVVLLVSDSKAYSFSPHSIDQHQEAQLQSVHVPWEKKKPLHWRFQILGSCNGLLLLSIDEDLFLGNPLTRFFKKLLAYYRLLEGNMLGENIRVCSGLTYDSTRDEYKVVLALYPDRDYGDEFVVGGCFRRKSWTVVDEQPYWVRSMHSGPIVDGKMHWFASKKYVLSCHQIIYFNAQMDKFEEVPMPEPRGEDGDIICALGVLDGCLCMSRFVHPGNSESNIDVLIMKEYGVKTSWTILFTSSNSFALRRCDTLMPLGYTKNGEVLMIEDSRAKDKKRQISAFNLTDNTHRRILGLKNHSVVIAHEESLVTPIDNHWEEEEQKGEATYIDCGIERGDHYSLKVKKDKHGYWHAEPNSD